MIQKIRKILGLESIQDKYLEYRDNEEQLSILKSNLDELVDDYNVNSKNYIENRSILKDRIEKGISGQDNLLKHIEDRFNGYFQDYLNRVSEIRKGLDKINKSQENLLNNQELKQYIEKENKIESYQIIKKAYKNKQISKDVFEKSILEVEGYLESIEKDKEVNKAIDVLNLAYEKGLISKDVIEKANHKYIRKEFKGGKTNYIYKDSKNDSINIKEVREYATKVISGEKHIDRFSQEEERGCVLGGRRNVEASIILGRNESSSQKDKRVQGERRLGQEKVLEDYAKKVGIWHDNLDEFLSEKNFVDSGSENKVFRYSESKVAKINSFEVDKEPMKYLDRLALHNMLFPDVKYEVIGFGKDKRGKFSVLIKQPFIESSEETSKEDIDNYMNKLGFKPDGLYSYSNENYILSDVHEANVLKNGDQLYFIDTFISKNDLGEIKKAFESTVISRKSKTKYADCIVTSTEGKFLFLKRDPNNDFQPDVYSLPGGHVDPGEKFEEAAIRELEEETGLKAERADYVFTYEDDNCIIKYFECKIEPNNPFSFDTYDVFLHGNEHSNYKWMNYQEYKNEDLIMNLKDVLEEIYGDEIIKQQNEEIKKAFELTTKAYQNKQIDDDTYLKVLYNYEEFEKSLVNHKYIRKVFKNGKWDYVYEESKYEPEKEDLKEYKKQLKGLKEKDKELQAKLESRKSIVLSNFKQSNIRGCNLNESNVVFKVSFSRYLADDKEYKDLLGEISQNNYQIYQIGNEVNYDKLSAKEFDYLKRFSQEKFYRFCSLTKNLIPFRDLNQNVTKDDYYIGTDTVFDKIEVEEGRDVLDKWEELKKLGDHKLSPKSSSEYIITEEGVYRLADHWGRCASCFWIFNGTGEEWGYHIGFSKFEDFKVNGLSGGYYVTNPEYIEKAPSVLNEAMLNLESIKKSFKLTDNQKLGIDNIQEDLKRTLSKVQSTIDNTEEDNIKSDDEIKKSVEEDIEKAISKYGENKHTERVKVTKNGKTFYREQQVGGGEKGKQNESKEYSDEELAEHAKNASEQDLQRHIKENGNEKMRIAAHNELKRREEKEKPKEDDSDIKLKKDQEKQDKKDRNKWLEEYSKYKLSRLPIDIDKKEVQINTSGDTDSHWVMKWVDPKTKKEVRSYTQGFMKKNAEYKWERIQNISSKDIDNIKNVASKALNSKDEKEQQIGAVLLIISNTGLRVGSRDGFNETQNRGVTTLNSENIKINGDKISLEFRGKSYKNNTAEFENKELAEYLSNLSKNNSKEDFIFNKITDDYVRDYFHDNVNKDWKIKDMRTFVATNMARQILFEDKNPPPPLPEKKSGIKKLVQSKLSNVYKLVSEQLNNTPSMAKNSYIHPKVTEEWLEHIGAKELM